MTSQLPPFQNQTNHEVVNELIDILEAVETQADNEFEYEDSYMSQEDDEFDYESSQDDSYMYESEFEYEESYEDSYSYQDEFDTPSELPDDDQTTVPRSPSPFEDCETEYESESETPPRSKSPAIPPMPSSGVKVDLDEFRDRIIYDTMHDPFPVDGLRACTALHHMEEEERKLMESFDRLSRMELFLEEYENDWRCRNGRKSLPAWYERRVTELQLRLSRFL
jgi:hypothetical protein